MPGQVLGLQCKLFSLGVGSPPGAPVNIGHLRDFSGPQFSAERVEVTDGDSTGREYLAGLQSPGTLPFTMYLDKSKAAQTALLTDIQTTPVPVKTYRLQYSAATTDFFQGLGFPDSLNYAGNAVNTPVTIDGSLALSGTWTYTKV
jgi:hypothetical protein